MYYERRLLVCTSSYAMHMNMYKSYHFPPMKKISTMGFTKTLLQAGTGAKPVRGQTVTVHCTGYGKNGDLSVPFWSTKDAGQEPFSFSVGMNQVIKGWDESVIDMQVSPREFAIDNPIAPLSNFFHNLLP